MSEIKGIDQIFPKKADQGGVGGNIRLWVVAAIVTTLVAGYAFYPTSKSTGEPTRSVLSLPGAMKLPAQGAAELSHGFEKKGSAQGRTFGAVAQPVVAVDDKAAKRLEAKIQLQQRKKSEVAQAVPEGKATVKALGGRSCDCETAELNLPALCPDASCRQCKASCGIPGN